MVLGMEGEGAGGWGGFWWNDVLYQGRGVKVWRVEATLVHGASFHSPYCFSRFVDKEKCAIIGKSSFGILFVKLLAANLS